MSETTSALRAAAWRGDLSDEIAEQQRRRLRHLPIRWHPSADLVEDAWELAVRLGWATTYDAEYVSLAGRLGIPLLSLDARLVRRVSSLVEILAPADLG